MPRVRCLALIACAVLCAGCSGSTAHWIEQLKSPEVAARLKAVRVLQERKADSALVVPALIEALKDENTDVRRSAAGTLGTFGEDARSAIPALASCLRDAEPAVRRSAGAALQKIDAEAARKAGVK
jgi:HEAT repeat protein